MAKNLYLKSFFMYETSQKMFKSTFQVKISVFGKRNWSIDLVNIKYLFKQKLCSMLIIVLYSMYV